MFIFHHIFSTVLSFALLALGFFNISASEDVMGLVVNILTLPVDVSVLLVAELVRETFLKIFFAILSSKE